MKYEKKIKSLMMNGATCAALCIFVVACSPTTTQRGNMVQDYQLVAVQPGISTRSDVLRNMGSPTTKAPFNENVWYYIGQKTEKRGILDPEIVDERVVVVVFDDEDMVVQAGELDRERIDLPIDRDKTPTYGNEMTAMQQLLGNLGKFSGGQGGATTTAGGGGL